MSAIKNLLQFAFFINALIVLSKANEFFQCLENSEFSNFKHCSLYVNKWDRLPPQIRPIQYRLTLQPFIHLSDEKKFYFRGSVGIEYEPEVSHKHLIIHAGKNLVFTGAKIKLNDERGRNIRIESIHYIRSRKWLLITLEERLPAREKYYIYINGFSSKFSKKANGFYSFSYKINKIKHYGANILLSPFYARIVFPCFDDPIFETKIKLNLIHKDYFVSQSIMDIEKTQLLENRWVVDNYMMTPRMQVYQFSFSINTFTYFTDVTSAGHLLRLWAPKEKLHECKFSMEKIKNALVFYEGYFNSSYVFDKLDIVVTMKMPPYETGSSTYGILIFLDSIIFIDDEKTLPRMKQIYVNTINHEVAHQWIGNVMRIEWFDGLWIIEGLVGYMEQKIKTHQTQYNHRLATALTQTLTGLFTDDTGLNHKLAIYPYSAKHVEKYFDDLIFTKGFSLFKMIDGVVGERNFRYALRKIVNDKDLKPLADNDLWKHMDDVLAEKDIQVSIEQIMEHWQSKRGFPIVKVNIRNGNQMVLHQKGNLGNNEELLWPIPITYLVNNGEERSDPNSIIWLNERSKIIHLEKVVADDDWFVLNHEQVGFFRVNYEFSNWILLIHQLRMNHTHIPPIARLQIFDDIFQFYCNGDIPGADTIFDVLAYLENENEFTIWKYSKFIIDFLYSFFNTRESYAYFRHFINRLISNLMSKIQWTKHNSLTLTIQMRDKLIFMYACRFQNKYCYERTDEYFDYWLEDNEFIAPLYLYGPMLCTGIERGDRTVWLKVLKSLVNPKGSSDQKLIIAQSLACSRDEEILSNYWNIMLTNKAKYKNLYQALLSSLAKNVYARPVFVERICSSSVNITKNPFEFAATLAALNNFILPENCAAMDQLHAIRFKRSTGDNLEIESSLNTDETRKFLYHKHLMSLEKWLKNNINDF